MREWKRQNFYVQARKYITCVLLSAPQGGRIDPKIANQLAEMYHGWSSAVWRCFTLHVYIYLPAGCLFFYTKVPCQNLQIATDKSCGIDTDQDANYFKQERCVMKSQGKSHPFCSRDEGVRLGKISPSFNHQCVFLASGNQPYSKQSRLPRYVISCSHLHIIIWKASLYFVNSIVLVFALLAVLFHCENTIFMFVCSVRSG